MKSKNHFFLPLLLRACGFSIKTVKKLKGWLYFKKKKSKEDYDHYGPVLFKSVTDKIREKN